MKTLLPGKILCRLLTLLVIAGCDKTTCKPDTPVTPMAIAGNYFLQWQKLLGGSQIEDAPMSAITPDGGIVVAGTTTSNDGDVSGNHGGADVWVVKLDGNGNLKWQKTYGGTEGDVATAMAVSADGGLVIVGATFSNNGDVSGLHGDGDMWVIKLDGNGILQWQRALGGPDFETAYAVITTPGGEIVVAGTSASNEGDINGNHGHYDAWLVGLDGSGNIRWQKTLGGLSEDGATGIVATPDGGWLIAGYTASNEGDVSGNHGDCDVWVIKLDGSRNLQWQKALGGTGDDRATEVALASDGGFAVTAITGSNDGDVNGSHGLYDAWVVKLDGSGNLKWQKILGGSVNDRATGIIVTSDGDWVVTGDTESNDADVSGNHGDRDMWVVRLDENGNKAWQKTLGGTGRDEAGGITLAPDGGLVISAYTESNNADVSGNHGLSDIWLMKWRLQ